MKELIRIKSEKKALNLSMYGGIIFVIVEFFVALYTKSQAVLMDSAYDAAELVMIFASIRIIPLLYRPSTEKHPFGFSQIEAIFITIKGAMLTAVTVGLVLNNIQIMLSGGRSVEFTTIAYFELFATGLSIIIIFFLKQMNKKLKSPMVKTELDGWMIDTVASLGMALAFLLPVFVKSSWMTALSPYLDQIIAILLSFFILPVPIKTVLSGAKDIVLWSPGSHIMDMIKQLCGPIITSHGYKTSWYDVVKTGRKLWISIYIKPILGDTFSIPDLQKLQKQLEAALLNNFTDLYIELVPEVD